MLEGANPKRQAIDFDLPSLRIEVLISRDLRQALKDIDLTEFGADEGPVASPQKGRDRRGVEEAATHIDFPSQLPEEGIEFREVFRIRVRNHVYVLGSSQVPPGVDREATDEDESDLRLDQPLEQLT